MTRIDTYIQFEDEEEESYEEMADNDWDFQYELLKDMEMEYESNISNR